VLVRESSKSTFPAGANVIRVPDELTHSVLVQALKGQDAVVAAIGFPSLNAEYKLIDAAIEAGVERFLPSEFGVNNTHPKARELCPIFNAKGEVIEHLRSKEGTGLSWTAVSTGLWLDW
jgi:putative NADH-flavin reductase